MKHRLPSRAVFFAHGLLLILVMVEVAACTVSRNPISGRRRAYGYTWEQERQLGAQADQQIIQQMGVYDDPDLAAYVERIGRQVLEESHLREPDADPEYLNTPFTFRIMDSPVVNAFALPGGYIYVTRGLLTHLNNEAQLAVVLGHEIVHVAARHASQRAVGAQTGQLATVLGAILGQATLGGSAGQTILDLGGTATQLLLLSYGRDDERESDRHGVAYAAQAGYAAEEAAEFFVTLDRLGERSGSGTIPAFLSTHPDPGEREETIRELAADWRQQSEMSLVREDEYLQLIDGTILGDDPRQGFVQNGVFYHPELRFRFPAPSQFLLDNGRSQVTMVEQNQQAVMTFSIAANATSPRDAAAQLLNQQGISVQESGATRVNGLDAFYATATAQLEGGQNVGLLTYFIQHSGNVYYFVGIAPVASFNNFAGVFRQTMTGFAPENRAEILNIQPTRVRVVRASRTAPFSSFVSSELPPDWTAEELAILNQVDLNEQISAGTLLKLP